MDASKFCVVMAGGVGSRFWPKSRANFPKQFQDFLGTGESLIQQTVRRVLKICPKENIFIVTNEAYKSLCLDQLPDLTENQILCEPCMRNTAPCIAYASYKIKEINPNASILVASSDHLITKEDLFVEVVNKGIEFANSQDALVTIGISPSRPDTGYGYINFSEENSEVKKVIQFTEKPDLETAKQFITSGDYSWNSGMFIWRVDTIIEAFKLHLPDIHDAFDQPSIYNKPEEKDAIDHIYESCENISIDYGIMEKAENVYVINTDIGWSDLGTWGSVYTHLPHDDGGNAVVGDRVMLYDSTNCVVNVSDEKLTVIEGLDNYIVVESGNALLICDKGNEQMIKQFVSDIKKDHGEGKYV